MNFSGAYEGYQVGNEMLDNNQRQESIRRELEGQAALVKALTNRAGSGRNPFLPPTPMPGASTMLPWQQGPQMPPQGMMNPGQGAPSGVSPSGGAMPPAGGAPGGAGPINPMGGAPSMPGGAPGMDIYALAQAMQSQGGTPGGQGAGLQALMKMLQPSMTNATRYGIADLNATTRSDIADRNIGSRESIADKNIGSRENIADKNIKSREGIAGDNRSSRERIAEANRLARSSGSAVTAKLKDDPVYRAREAALRAAQSANAANGTPDTYAALLKASDDLLAYAEQKDKASTTAAAKSPGDKPLPAQAAPVTHPLPAGMETMADGTRVPDSEGRFWTKKGNVLVPVE